jgi:Zn-dependent protease with chaperone function
MNFFEAQERSRRSTTLLIVLFAMAVIALIVMANVLVMITLGFVDGAQMQNGQTLLGQMDWQRFAVVGAGVGVVVLAGSLYKIAALSAGGKVVAESLGGQLVPQNTQDLNQRKLLNVVEEMAIASGTPVPPVYLLTGEPGINAFAAGFSPRDAVIGVTQGAIDQLTREQLQGVIAHEFSHIFNGDMKLNIRLIGALNGILVLGIIGYYLLRSASFSGRRRNNDKGAGGIMALAVGLIAIGFAGTFFGNLIKAAVSRQREYLADASAVQFTRNPNGLAGALKRIGGLTAGSTVSNPGAPEVSHAFFAQGVSGMMQWLAATHPPLAERIRRIDPHWDGEFDGSDRRVAKQTDEQVGVDDAAQRWGRSATTGAVAAGAAAIDLMTVMERIGNPQQDAVAHAQTLLAELPTVVRDAAREPYGARAVIYAMLLDKAQTVRTDQLKRLQDHADPDVYALTLALSAPVSDLDSKFRLPLIDIAIPALKQLSPGQYASFKANLVALIEMDSRIDLLEWSLQKILFHALDGQFGKPSNRPAGHSDLARVGNDVGLVLSVIAHTGSDDPRDVQGAFDASRQVLASAGLELLAKDQIRIADLDRALLHLESLRPLDKSRFLKACAAAVLYDQGASAIELELLRAFAGALDCPMPLSEG